MKGKMEDELKRAGLETLVPEELEKHLIFNSNRVKTFEDARSETVKYVEEKFGLRIRDFEQGKAELCKRSDPSDVGVVSSLLSAKGKSSDPRSGCFKCDAAHFQRDCNASKNMCKQMSGAGNQNKSWSMSEPSSSGKGKSKENQGETKGLSKGTKSETKGAKGSCKGKTSEMRQVDNDDMSWIHKELSPDERKDGCSFDELNDDGKNVEWREDCEQTHVTSASSFSLESSEWEKMNLDTRVAVNASNFDREGIGDGNFHDWIPDGEAWQFQGYDEHGFPRSLDGRLMDAYELFNSTASASSSRAMPELAGVPKVLDSAAKIACKEQQDFYVKHNGGYMIPTHSKIG